jgi:glycosyltransferase involved in cell wall biosynthesis
MQSGTAVPAAPVRLDPAPPGAHRIVGQARDVSADGGGHPAGSVSVILCVYHADQLGPLREAVSSVLAQTHRDVVLRILADGPVAADVRAYLEGPNDGRVQVRFSRTSQGLAASLNGLIDDSLHEGARFIARMNAADTSHPERLAKQLACLQRRPEIAVLGTGRLEIDEDTGQRLVTILPADDRTLKRDLVKRTPFVDSSVVFRSAVFAGGTRYRSGPAEDRHLWVDLARYGWAFANLPEPLVTHQISSAECRRRSPWSTATAELSARVRTMRELCMITPGNIAWTVAGFVLRLLPAPPTRRGYRYRRPLGDRA